MVKDFFCSFWVKHDVHVLMFLGISLGAIHVVFGIITFIVNIEYTLQKRKALKRKQEVKKDEDEDHFSC